MAEHHGVIVTLPEIYEDVQATKKQVVEMNTKLDQFIKLNERLDSHKADIANHEERLRKLEVQTSAHTDHEPRLRKAESQIAAQWVVVSLVVAAVSAAVVKAFVG